MARSAHQKKATCPNCSRSSGHSDRVIFNADWNRTEGADSTPIWHCCNCAHTMPRRIRRTKRQIAADKCRADREGR